jgi:RHH-type proline utilization regulon transcriptional repressor/proline dehydrogenase/delta 1-pyrroline-5-carboxylate dehydrogenase
MRCNAQISPALQRIAKASQQDEHSLAREIQAAIHLSSDQRLRADAIGHLLSQKLRIARQHAGGIDSLLAQYPLASPAGRALFNLAEGVLRIHDRYQLDRLIAEQLHAADWHQHRGTSSSWLINLATLGLDLAEQLQAPATTPLIREAVKKALSLLAEQFIIAEDLGAALMRQNCDFRYSFDMLGEAALSQAEALNYMARYAGAIHQLGEARQGAGNFGPSVSVKLSALHEKFDGLHIEQIHRELYPRLFELALIAKQYDLGLTIDAEESSKQLLTLSLFERLLAEPDLLTWSGLGIAVQAYQKNAYAIVSWLSQYTRQHHRAISVRLVKGAYWDSEIKAAQQASLAQYPVWTSKEHTDQSYLACAQVLLQAENRIYSQFATHNAFTLASIAQMAGTRNFEFQALFGMGETVYQLAKEIGIDQPCRLYAPIGTHAQLLPYLVRRFLENGANTSFVHQVLEKQFSTVVTSKIAPPNQIFSPRDVPALANPYFWPEQIALEQGYHDHQNDRYIAKPSTWNGIEPNTHPITIFNPADQRDIVGQCYEAIFSDIEQAFGHAASAQPSWGTTSIEQRAALIEAVAQQLETQRENLLHLLIREAGKTQTNAQHEFREAIDFCRYYAAQARQNWSQQSVPALGTIVAISPWNFPLAIFMGQIACALVAGNVVIAKPAPETPLIAAQALECFYRAGIPRNVLQLLPGGKAIGAALTYDHRCAGVCFTGSLGSAIQIRQALAEFGARPVLVAETGGVNAMIVDSSAQIDQAIRDILHSAFDSAGQRCSALRLLCVQHEIADSLIIRLNQSLHSLRIGLPQYCSTEVGPVIHAKAQQKIEAAIQTYRRLGCPVSQAVTPEDCQHGHFVPPAFIEINTLAALSEEIFGPVLCIYRYQAKELDAMLADINHLGYGLTMGIHSRISAQIEHIIARTQVGNYYINRNMIGAVVGAQPFGGQNKSGTGPKAGGPWALWRMVANRDPCNPHYQALAPTWEQVRSIVQLWPDLDQGVDLEILLEDAARRSPIGQSCLLPSTCGERNLLCYRGRGHIACLGPTDWDLVQQVGIAILTGNVAIISDQLLLNQWRPYLNSQQLLYSAEPLDELELHAVMAHHSIADASEKYLAQRDGAIVPLIAPYEDGKWPLFRLVSEYTITTNTAASGGDISLLTTHHPQ